MRASAPSRQWDIWVLEAVASLFATLGLALSFANGTGDLIAACTAFLALILTGETSRGCANPIGAVCLLWADRRSFVRCVLAQAGGATGGALLSWLLLGRRVVPLASFRYEDILAELFGGLALGLCLLVLTNQFLTHTVRSWQTYLSFAFAFYLIRKVTGCRLLNPAAALLLQVLAACSEAAILPLGLVAVLPASCGAVGAAFVFHYGYEGLLLSAKAKEFAMEDEPGAESLATQQ